MGPARWRRRSAVAGLALLIVALGTAAAAVLLWPGGGGNSQDASPFLVPKASDSLAFVRGKEGVSADIYVARSDGTHLRRVTRGPGFKIDPDWSPDGKWLLYRYESPGPAAERPERRGLVVMHGNGTGAVDIATRADVYAGPASWAPSGTRIVFSGGQPGEPPSIYSIDRDGSKLRRLTAPAREAQYPAWAPDGRKIAFTYVDPGGSGFSIYVMDAGGSNAKRLTDGPQDNWPVWSPDSRRIAFSRADSIWTMNADGSDAQLVTRSGGAPLNWSPAKDLVFSCARKDGSIGACAVSSEGTGFRRLLSGAHGGFPAWRPRAAKAP